MWSRSPRWVVFALIVASTSVLVLPLSAQTKKVPSDAAKSPSDGGGAKRQVKDGEGMKDAFMRKLKEALDAADDITGEDRGSTDQVLRDADAVLTRIREENRRALEQVNRQPRVKDSHCPNIVLFLLNGVGYGDLGSYGQKLIKTPIADLLATHGTRFTQFYAGSPESVASRGTLYNGRLSARGEQVGGDWVTLRERDFTLAEMLYQGGYETGLFGIWGAGPVEHAGRPNGQGFKTFFGYLDDPSAQDFYPPTLWHNGDRVSLTGNQGGAKKQYAPDLIVEAAKRFIDAEYKHPFFLTVAFPMSVSGSGQQLPDLNPYADQDWPELDKARAAMLTRVDRYMGEILTRVQERRVMNRTMVIVTSDRGPPGAAVGSEDRFLATGGLRGAQGELYEGGIRVPFIIHWAGTPLAPAESDLSFGMWDLLPTLREMTFTRRSAKSLDGVSVVGRLRGPVPGDTPPGSPLYWEKHAGGLAQAVRVEDWKGVRPSAAGRWELYDLKTDPAESKDAADSHPEVVERIDEWVKALRP